MPEVCALLRQKEGELPLKAMEKKRLLQQASLMDEPEDEPEEERSAPIPVNTEF